MATTTNTGLNQPVYNSTSPTWDQPLNYNETILDAVFGNTTSIAMPTGASATTTLTGPTSSGSLGQTQAMRITLTGALSANQVLQFPSGVAGRWIIYNTTSGSFSITVSSAGGGTSVSAPQGYNVSIYTDGTNIRYTDDGLTNNFATLTVLGNTYLATTSGNVGIGTSTMTGKLNVVSSTNGFGLYVTDGTYSGGLIPSSSTGGLILYNGVAQPLGFWTNNAERMRIDSSGNVGIGTSSPTSKLTVAGNLSIQDGAGFGWAGLSSYVGGSSASNFINFITASSERMRIDSSGNVGIGTTSPGYKLDIQSATGNMQLKSTTSTNYVLLNLLNAGYNYLGVESSTGGSLFTGSSAYALTLGTVSAYPVQFATSNTVRATIDSSGNVGIGTTSPSSYGKLTIIPSSQVTTVAGANQFMIGEYTQTSNYYLKAGYAFLSSTWTGVIDAIANGSGTNLAINPTGGNVCIGTTSPSTILTVNGTVTATSFTGAGTGLTGTASSLSIGGNSATATTAGNVSGTVAVANGGTGLTSTPANGAIDIGNGTGFTRSTITAGTGITVTNGAGYITIANSSTSSGTLLRAPQILTSGTSYTTPAGCNSIYVEVVGGGGGSGSGPFGGGGAGGGYAAKYFTVSPSTAYTYAVGSAGTGGAVTGGGFAGTSGGNTTFTVGGTTITGAGGGGGGPASGSPVGGTGGIGTSGDLNTRGGGGGSGGSGGIVAGIGGNSFFGGTAAPGATGSQYGGGAGGQPANSNGINGFQGVVRITEYS